MKCAGCGSQIAAETGALEKASPDLQELFDLFDVDSLSAVAAGVAENQTSLDAAVKRNGILADENEKLRRDLAAARKERRSKKATPVIRSDNIVLPSDAPAPAPVPASAPPKRRGVAIKLR